MIRTLTQATPRGEIEIERWDPRKLTKSRTKTLETVFREILMRGQLYAANREKRDLLPGWPYCKFDPFINTLMIPSMRGAGQQTFQETLITQSVAGTLFATYTTAKTVIPATNLITLPAQWWQIGRSLRINVTGAISNIVTTPGLMNFQVKIGSVAAYDTGNIQLNATAHTTLPFWLEILLTCRAIGSGTSANIMGVGVVTGLMFTLTAGQTDSAQGHQSIVVPQTNPAVGTGFDSTVANILDLWVGFTISNGGNGVRIDQYVLNALN